MQEHLHVGRPSWKRLGRFVLILFLACAFPVVIGLHMRGVAFELRPQDATGYVGHAISYDGYPHEYYGITTNQITPLFILVPPLFAHSDIYGMKWLKP